MAVSKLIVFVVGIVSFASYSRATILARTPYGEGVIEVENTGFLQAFVHFTPNDPSKTSSITSTCGEEVPLPCREGGTDAFRLALGDILMQGETEEPITTDEITVTTSCCGTGQYIPVRNGFFQEIFHFFPESPDQTSFITATCGKGVGVPCEQAFGGEFNLAWSEITNIGILPDCED